MYKAMRFVWGRRKNRSNIAHHGIAFEDEVRIFEGATLEREDDRFDYGEVRYYAIGCVNGLEIVVIYTVIYTERSENERRIISAWRAEVYEREEY